MIFAFINYFRIRIESNKDEFDESIYSIFLFYFYINIYINEMKKIKYLIFIYCYSF